MNTSGGVRKQPPLLQIYASNEPKSVLAQDLGDCRDNLRNSRSVFLIVQRVCLLNLKMFKEEMTCYLILENAYCL